MFPGVDVANRTREEAGAAFGRGIVCGEAIHEPLDLWMANRLLENAERHERDAPHGDSVRQCGEERYTSRQCSRVKSPCVANYRKQWDCLWLGVRDGIRNWLLTAA